MDHSLGLDVDFTEGGKLDNREKNPQSTGETNYNNSSHMNSKFFQNQHETKLRWSPSHINFKLPHPTGLNLKFNGERQCANRIFYLNHPNIVVTTNHTMAVIKQLAPHVILVCFKLSMQLKSKN